jgi:hypothetical protein
MGLRRHDGLPTIDEMLLHLIIWSIVLEVIGPRFYPRAVADVWDILAYFVGAAGAWLFWHKYYCAKRMTSDFLTTLCKQRD